MKHKILKGFLIAGVVLGFGSGFAHVGARWAMHCKDRGAHCARSCPDGSRWGHRHGGHGSEIAPAGSPVTPPAAGTNGSPLAP